MEQHALLVIRISSAYRSASAIFNPDLKVNQRPKAKTLFMVHFSDSYTATREGSPHVSNLVTNFGF